MTDGPDRSPAGAMPRLEISPEVDPTWVKVGARGAGQGALHDRGEFYEAHRQTKLVSVGGAQLDEAALGAYRREIESRLAAAIRPAAEEGEQPLLPVLHDMAGIGTTDISPFLTVRQCQPTIRSHLSQAVPDFLVELADAAGADGSVEGRGSASRDGEATRGTGEHLVIEVKGLEREQDRAKEVGVGRWIAAVNRWGRLDRWRFAKIHSPHDLGRGPGGPGGMSLLPTPGERPR